jgi:hypothetical protein
LSVVVGTAAPPFDAVRRRPVVLDVAAGAIRDLLLARLTVDHRRDLVDAQVLVESVGRDPVVRIRSLVADGVGDLGRRGVRAPQVVLEAGLGIDVGRRGVTRVIDRTRKSFGSPDG